MNKCQIVWNQDQELEFNAQVSIDSAKKSFFLKKWSGGESESLILAFHDIGGYHGSFRDFSKWMVSENKKIDVIVVDMLGHGLSSGIRGHLENMNDLIYNYINLLEKIDFSKYKKIYFLGQGAGGLLALELYTHFENKLNIKLSGIILSNFILNFESVFFKITPWNSLKYIFNHLKLYKLYEAKDLTSDNRKIDQIESDPLYVHGATFQTFNVFMKKSQSVYQDSYFLEIPVLSLIGLESRKILNSGMEYFHKGLKKEILTKKVYANFKHDLYNEKESPLVFKDILNWIEENE